MKSYLVFKNPPYGWQWQWVRHNDFSYCKISNKEILISTRKQYNTANIKWINLYSLTPKVLSANEEIILLGDVSPKKSIFYEILRKIKKYFSLSLS